LRSSFILAVLLALLTCELGARDTRIHKQARYLMGTLCEITVYAEESQANSAMNAAFAELKRIDGLLSNWKEDSDLMRMNRAAGTPANNGSLAEITVENELFERVRIALSIAHETGGLFDPTVGPLVRAWGFLPARQSATTRNEEIQKARGRVGWEKVHLQEEKRSVQFAVPGMEVDLGGIAKGYAAARAADVLKSYGIESGFINLGGSSMMAIGSPPGREGWPVFIRDPRDGETPAAEIELHDGEALATSGTYEKTVGAGKHRHSHIMNPITGEAVGGATSVTIVMDDAETADALTKPFFFLAWPPAEDWARLLERHPKASVILMTARGKRLERRLAGAQPQRFRLQKISLDDHAAEAY
jgi:FAD:protein FMN transferase